MSGKNSKHVVCCAPQRAPLIALSLRRGLGLAFLSKIGAFQWGGNEANSGAANHFRRR
jgi:hypothetical protein